MLAKLEEHDGAKLLSALSLVELQRDLHKTSPYAPLRRARYDVLIRHLPVLPFDAAAAEAYGAIIAQCSWARGRDYDRMIAAHTISMHATLVTNDADFTEIPGLALEDWLIAAVTRPS